MSTKIFVTEYHNNYLLFVIVNLNHYIYVLFQKCKIFKLFNNITCISHAMNNQLN